jgi:hypothetical protein
MNAEFGLFKAGLGEDLHAYEGNEISDSQLSVFKSTIYILASVLEACKGIFDSFVNGHV